MRSVVSRVSAPTNSPARNPNSLLMASAHGQVCGGRRSKSACSTRARAGRALSVPSSPPPRRSRVTSESGVRACEGDGRSRMSIRQALPLSRRARAHAPPRSSLAQLEGQSGHLPEGADTDVEFTPHTRRTHVYHHALGTAALYAHRGTMNGVHLAYQQPGMASEVRTSERHPLPALPVPACVPDSAAAHSPSPPASRFRLTGQAGNAPGAVFAAPDVQNGAHHTGHSRWQLRRGQRGRQLNPAGT